MSTFIFLDGAAGAAYLIGTMPAQNIPEPQNAHEYWNLIENHTPRERRTDVWCALNTQIKSEVGRHAMDEGGTQSAIQWLASCDMPKSLGLCDGTEYDTLRAYIIQGLQHVLVKRGVSPEALPANAPLAARWVRQGQLAWQEGGSNRAQEKHDAEARAARLEVEKLNSTEACKDALAKKYKDHPNAADPKAWKRGSKLAQGDITARVFTCGAITATVFFDQEEADCGDANGAVVIKEGNCIPKPDKDTVRALQTAAKSIRHCGDYGTLFYSPNKREVVWVGGDGDGGEDHTDFRDIKRMLSVPGVDNVEIFDEHDPDLKDGFICLGRHGGKNATGVSLPGGATPKAPAATKSPKVK